MNGTQDQNFTMKEIVIEIKDDLKAFRLRYDADQADTDDEMAKRPTRTELWSTLTGIGVIVGIVVAVVS